MREKFWELPLDQLDKAEWEALCDGCGKCCLIKLEDEDTGEIVYTRLACKLFDSKACGCSQYGVRKMLVPDCLQLTLESIPENANWLPSTCAYVRRFQNKALPSWHHLLTGSTKTMHDGAHSVINRTESESVMKELEDAIPYIDRSLGPK